IGFSTNNVLSSTTDSDCPEPQESDIMILTAVLGHSDLLNEMQDLGLNITNIKIDGDVLRKKEDISGFLRSYWKDNGVRVVSDPGICQDIIKSLNTERRNISYPEDIFRSVFYQVGDDRYV